MPQIHNAEFTEQGSTPSTPSSGTRGLYPKATGWFDLDDAGTETGPFVSGSTGSTDNALLRANGTAATTMQATGLTVNDSDTLEMADNVIERPKLLDVSETVNAIGGIGGGTQDIDLESGNIVTGTVDTSETTFTFSNPPASGSYGRFRLILTNGGSQTVNWPGGVVWAGGSGPSLTASGVDVLEFFTVDAGTTWYGLSLGLNFS